MASPNASVEASRQFKVGDDMGWQQPPHNNTSFYAQWAATKRFHVGDSLVFEYQNDSIMSVEKWDYYHCDSSEPITAFNNGKSIVNLESNGAFYFISGTDDHCINGQRLMVDVMSPHPPSISAPSPSLHHHHHTSSALSLSTFSLILLLAFGVSFSVAIN
ncbi:Early nodulin-like protein 1 [Senna tora]|uniref:Early nodulin-like protein 1 n=1 Tax=Senna tora TaxID=362788 RepID=A0A834WCM4_9FABA|nr:Early nodulin-like protein 1 [Senna tora]